MGKIDCNVHTNSDKLKRTDDENYNPHDDDDDDPDYCYYFLSEVSVILTVRKVARRL